MAEQYHCIFQGPCPSLWPMHSPWNESRSLGTPDTLTFSSGGSEWLAGQSWNRIGKKKKKNLTCPKPTQDTENYCFFKNKFIYFWLHWVFVAVCRLSLVAASRGYSSLWCMGFSSWWLLLWTTGSGHVGFSSCGARA